jgi:predicted PolB exonuclease-like 3'-5' exonuclease
MTTLAVDPRWAAARRGGLVGDQILVVDIETVSDPDCPPPEPKGGAKDAMPPIPHNRIIAIGAAWIVGATVRKIGIVGRGLDEAAQLRAFVEIFEEAPPKVVGWNTRGFDMPVIAHRCLRHGIPWPWYYQDVRGGSPRYRYGDGPQLDLMDVLSDHGASRRSSLDSAARLMGLPGKLGTSGASVAQMWADEQDEQIYDYCCQDVAQTTALAFRFQLLAGKLQAGEYRQAMKSWEAACLRAGAGPSEVIATMDRARVMLEEKGTDNV